MSGLVHESSLTPRTQREHTFTIDYTMPKEIKTHNKCRENICLYCYEKANRPITENIKEQIRQQRDDYKEYNFGDILNPCGICNRCHLLLRKGKDLPATAHEWKNDR